MRAVRRGRVGNVAASASSWARETTASGSGTLSRRDSLCGRSEVLSPFRATVP